MPAGAQAAAAIDATSHPHNDRHRAGRSDEALLAPLGQGNGDRDRCTPDKAFELLTRISQNHNIKIQQLARTVVEAALK